MTVEIRAAEVNVMFSEAYDLMPALPRPLKSKHKLVYITANGLMLESLSVAPLTRTEEKRLEELKLDHIRAVEGDSEELRTLKRLAIYMRRAYEFVLVNEELSAWYITANETIDTCTLAISAIVTAAVFWNFGGPLLPGMATLASGMIKSWSLYATYDVLYEAHRNSAASFQEIVETIQSIIYSIAELDTDEEKERVLMMVDGGKQSAAAAAAEQAGETPAAEVKAFRAMFWRERAAFLKDKGAAAVAAVQEAAKNTKSLKAEVKRLVGMKPKSLIFSPEDLDTEDCAPDEIKRKLRILYRKSVEYRLAHSMFETKFRKMRLALAFAHLFLSSLTSALLFLDIHYGLATLAALSVTVVGFLLKNLDLGALEIAHGDGRTFFSGLQRQFATVLMLSGDDAIVQRFPELAEKFYKAEKEASPLVGVELFKDPDSKAGFFSSPKKPLFNLISTEFLLKEKAAFQGKHAGPALAAAEQLAQDAKDADQAQGAAASELPLDADDAPLVGDLEEKNATAI